MKAFIYEIYNGKEIEQHLEEIAGFRIKYFKDYPYLYAGDLFYEKNYLNGYICDPKSMLIRILLNEKVVGISTSIPLLTSSDILTEAESDFDKAALKPEQFYYYGEVILDYSVRGSGLVKVIYDLQDKHAVKSGFSKACIATIVRSQNDSRKPNNYKEADLVWSSLGFKQTDITFKYGWPTIQQDGSVKDFENVMVYWIKNLEKK
ncbi:MAG: hypothetical protein H7Z71_05300 [Moraxellaceae bacterium]|nr:hypothetical protein [Pseudobdellovibrionaceae bacterium]